MPTIKTVHIKLDTEPSVAAAYEGLDEVRKGVVSTLIAFIQQQWLLEDTRSALMIGEVLHTAMVDSTKGAQQLAISTIILATAMSEEEFDKLVERAELANNALTGLMRAQGEHDDLKEAGCHVQ